MIKIAIRHAAQINACDETLRQEAIRTANRNRPRGPAARS